jgi:prepilin-type N-terminal cleavage/methylation domain-containing protein
MQEQSTARFKKRGFTLVELLMVVLMLGGLTAVAIVGFHGLDQTSGAAACDLTMSAAIAATAAYYVHARMYPQTFADLTHPPSGPPWLDAHGATETATTLRGKSGWKLQLVAGATPSDATTFTGC